MGHLRFSSSTCCAASPAGFIHAVMFPGFGGAADRGLRRRAGVVAAYLILLPAREAVDPAVRLGGVPQRCRPGPSASGSRCRSWPSLRGDERRRLVACRRILAGFVPDRSCAALRSARVCAAARRRTADQAPRAQGQTVRCAAGASRRFPVPGVRNTAPPRPTLERSSPMKILVPVKRVVDFNVKIRVKADGSGSNSPTSRCR